MILEVTSINIKSGMSVDFESAARRALKILSTCAGFHGAELYKSLDKADWYKLIVKWERVEDHIQGFQKTEKFTEWRSIIGCYFVAPPSVDHVLSLYRAEPLDIQKEG